MNFITDRPKEVFRGYQFAFKFDDPRLNLSQYELSDRISKAQSIQLAEQSRELVDMANKFLPKFNVYRN